MAGRVLTSIWSAVRPGAVAFAATGEGPWTVDRTRGPALLAPTSYGLRCVTRPGSAPQTGRGPADAPSAKYVVTPKSYGNVCG